MSSDFPAGVSAHSRYSLFKAADGKIALSVVYVNKKPQHIVFCLHSPHLFSKQRRLPVESANGHSGCGFRKPALPQNRCNPGTRENPLLIYYASPSRDRGQGTEMVQNGVILWRCGPVLSRGRHGLINLSRTKAVTAPPVAGIDLLP